MIGANECQHLEEQLEEAKKNDQEPLKLLARRLQGEEKSQFLKAIDKAAKLYWNKNVEAYLLNKVRTQEMVETAVKTKNWTNY